MPNAHKHIHSRARGCASLHLRTLQSTHVQTHTDPRITKLIHFVTHAQRHTEHISIYLTCASKNMLTHTCQHAHARSLSKTYTHMHTRTHTYIHACMHAYIHTYTHTYKQTYIHTDRHAYIHTYVRTYVHTYIHTHARANTHTDTYTQLTHRQRQSKTGKQTRRHTEAQSPVHFHLHTRLNKVSQQVTSLQNKPQRNATTQTIEYSRVLEAGGEKYKQEDKRLGKERHCFFSY